MRSQGVLTAVGLLLQLHLSFAAPQKRETLPVVDLGYELHQAAFFNETGGLYNFSNIRYAAPPLGNLRFAAPEKPAVNRGAVQNGSVGVVCPQANPAWELLAAEFVPAYLAGLPFNASASGATSNSSTSLPAQDPRTTEDCLFLDVVVPKAVFDKAGQGAGAPVMVWIYGGGYTAGDKSGGNGGNPAGLIKASQNNGNSSNGVIFVSLNYRLGAFGWLSGPTLQSNGSANAGLLDQRMALEWVQEHISSFGGNPNQVTVFGESAGGGSVMHQITAYGGLKGRVPFQQAIPQSPGWIPNVSNEQQEATLQQYLGLLNVSTIQEARSLPSNALIAANIIQIGLDSPYGSFTYGPTVDGSFVPALPGELLAQGQFDKSLRLLIGHNADEGLLFTSPFVTSDATYRQFLAESFPDATSDIINTIAEELYPPVFNTSLYKDETARTALTTSEIAFTCNTNYLARAFNNQTFAYLFDIPPALHGQDIPYTYFNGPSSGVNTTIAQVLQGILTSFAETGTPKVPQSVLPGFGFTRYGANAQILDLTNQGIKEITDPAAVARCLFWQKALFS